MTYHTHLKSARDTLTDTLEPVATALAQASAASQVDPVSSNGVCLGVAITEAKIARDRIDAALESLEAARSAATILCASHGGPVSSGPHLRVVATGTPPVADYPKGVA